MSSEPQRRGGNDEILTVDAVASELHCSRAHVCKAVRGLVSGVPPLPSIRMGRRVLIRRTSLEQWKNDAEDRSGGAILLASPEVHAARRMKGQNGHA